MFVLLSYYMSVLFKPMITHRELVKFILVNPAHVTRYLVLLYRFEIQYQFVTVSANECLDY